MIREPAGSAVFGLLPPLLAGLVVALVVVVDLGAYLDAASRAQAAADAGALAAAVAAHPDSRSGTHPRDVASEVVATASAELVGFELSRGRRQVEVTARVEVRGFVLPRVWARTVDAKAVAASRLERAP